VYSNFEFQFNFWNFSFSPTPTVGNNRLECYWTCTMMMMRFQSFKLLLFQYFVTSLVGGDIIMMMILIMTRKKQLYKIYILTFETLLFVFCFWKFCHLHTSRTHFNQVGWSPHVILLFQRVTSSETGCDLFWCQLVLETALDLFCSSPNVNYPSVEPSTLNVQRKH